MFNLLTADIAGIRAEIVRRPNAKALHLHLGLKLAAGNDHPAAIDCYERELSLYANDGVTSSDNPNVRDARWFTAVSYAELGQTERAASLVTGINLSRVTASGNRLSLKGDIYRRLRQLELARDAYLEAIAADKHCVVAHRWLSVLAHSPDLAIARPDGFAPPERSEWIDYEGFAVPDLNEDGTVLSWRPAPSAAWIRLFRGKIVVASWGFEQMGTGPTLMVERVAYLVRERWQLPSDFVWLALSENGVSDTMDFSRVSFGAQTTPGELGRPAWHPIENYQVEQLTGYRFIWGR